MIHQVREQVRTLGFRWSVTAIVMLLGSGCDTVIPSGPDSGVNRVARALRLDSANVSVRKGARIQLTATVLDQRQQPFAEIPEGTQIEWASSDSTVAIVDGGGMVTGVATGTAQIKASLATTIGKPSVSATVAVRGGQLYRIELDVDTVLFQTLTRTSQPWARVFDESGTEIPEPALEWRSEDPTIASATSYGHIRAENNGTTRVIVKVADSEAEDTVHVIVHQASAMVFVEPSELTMRVNEVFQAAATTADSVRKPVTTPYTLNWTSSNPAVAVVDEHGIITAISPGTTNIRVRPTPGTGTSYIQVTVQGSQPDHRLIIMHGDDQYAPNGFRLAEYLSIRLVTEAGEPVRGKRTVWTASNGGEIIVEAPETSDDGEVNGIWMLGPVLGTQTVTVRVEDEPWVEPVTFTATATKTPQHLVLVSGSGQSVRRGQRTPEPFVVRVNAADGTPVRGVRVYTMNGTGDRGTFEYSSTVTDENGLISIWYTPNGGNAFAITFDYPDRPGPVIPGGVRIITDP